MSISENIKSVLGLVVDLPQHSQPWLPYLFAHIQLRSPISIECAALHVALGHRMSPIFLYVSFRTVYSHLNPRPHVRGPWMHLNRHGVVGDEGFGLVPERRGLGLELDWRRKALLHHKTIIGLEHVGRTSAELLGLADEGLFRRWLRLPFLNHHSRILVWVRGDHYPRTSVGIRNSLFFFIPAEVETLLEACLDFVDVDGVDGGGHIVILVLV